MARAVLERELIRPQTGAVRFAVATEADDQAIRRLLRENPMPGKISVSLEREPNYFADAHLLDERKQTIVARENGQVVCVGSCVIRQRFVNGKPQQVGYLGGLRLDARKAGHFDIVRRGYEFFREIQERVPADFYFTSIASDNLRARKFLERGLPGMPKYEFLEELVTVLLPVGRRPCHHVEPAPAPNLDEFLALLNGQNRLRQFAATWSNADLTALQTLGLANRDFQYVARRRQMVAGAALWDQRVFKQTVIRDYAARLRLLRPVLNLVTSVFGPLQLPKVGSTLANAFVSHLFVDGNDPHSLVQLTNKLLAVASHRGIKLLTMGFAAGDPHLTTIRDHFHCREYLTRIYLVRWPGIGGASCELDGRLLAPEVALL